MQIDVIRFLEDKKSTVSHLLINGEYKCKVLEDAYRETKEYGSTRIQDGEYKLKLRTDLTPMNRKYIEKFGKEFHKGMIWLQDVPEFEFVYIHIGNYIEDTLGCLLVGENVIHDKKNDTFGIDNSTNTYKEIYPLVSDAILRNEEVVIRITSKYSK